MAVAVNSIISKVGIILQDEDTVRWTATELLGWLNEAQIEVVREKPEAYVTNAAVLLSAGTKQSLPSCGITLIDITRNMGTNGTTAGDSIRIIDKRLMDAMVPNWHNTLRAKAVVSHCMFDERDPKHYYVEPPSDGTNYIEIIYSVVPSAASAGGNITLDDIYEPIIMNYMIYRAFDKDSDFGSNGERAIRHYQLFLAALGSTEKAEALMNPNKSLVTTKLPVG